MYVSNPTPPSRKTLSQPPRWAERGVDAEDGSIAGEANEDPSLAGRRKRLKERPWDSYLRMTLIRDYLDGRFWELALAELRVFRSDESFHVMCRRLRKIGEGACEVQGFPAEDPRFRAVFGHEGCFAGANKGRPYDFGDDDDPRLCTDPPPGPAPAVPAEPDNDGEYE